MPGRVERTPRQRTRRAHARSRHAPASNLPSSILTGRQTVHRPSHLHATGRRNLRGGSATGPLVLSRAGSSDGLTAPIPCRAAADESRRRRGARASEPPNLKEASCPKASRCCRPAMVTGHRAWVPRRTVATQRGPAVSSRSTYRGRDRRRHATRRHRCLRGTAAGAHRRAVARRPAHRRSPRTRRSGPRSAARLAARAPRQGPPPTRGRHGRLGLGATATLAHRARRPAGRAAAVHRHRADTRSRVVSRRRAHRTAPRRARGPASGVASHRISSVTPPPSRWLARAYR